MHFPTGLRPGDCESQAYGDSSCTVWKHPQIVMFVHSFIQDFFFNVSISMSSLHKDLSVHVPLWRHEHTPYKTAGAGLEADTLPSNGRECCDYVTTGLLHYPQLAA